MKKMMRLLLAVATIIGIFTGNQFGDDPKGKIAYAAGEGGAATNPGYIAPEIYASLIDELMHVGDRSKRVSNKANIGGEIRYHYTANSGSERWNKDSSGIRVYLSADMAINKDWRAYGMLEGKTNIRNYANEYKLSRLYAAGKLGQAMVKAGSFSYLMAEGNIYDSGFDGIRADFSGGTVKYTVSYGDTNYTNKTAITTARYEDFDYDLETGFYHFETESGRQNTIRTFGGHYNFSNFGVGAMVLDSSLKDAKGNSTGYVITLNYGGAKSWTPGTYGVFAKYYDQPRWTYIAHGMNGIGSRMQGFEGSGIGINYTVARNLVAGIEYYDLKDKISGEKGKTWWSQMTHYF